MSPEEINLRLKNNYDIVSSTVTKTVLTAIDKNDNKGFAIKILNANAIYIVADGRTFLMAKAFANRLIHLGFACHIVGAETTPAITDKDLLIAASGSGTSLMSENCLDVAKKIGADRVVITSNVPSPLTIYANMIIEIAGRNSSNELSADYIERQLIGSNIESVAPMGTIFEESLLGYLDIIVDILMELTEQTAEDLKLRHENMSKIIKKG